MNIKELFERVEADKGNYKEFVKFIATAVMRSLEIYLKVLTPITKPREKFMLLSDAAIGTDYSAKYLNLLLKQGKLEGHKEGRNWLTTKEAIERYKSNRKRKR